MSEPIKDCPQPETPIRERAYTPEQEAAMNTDTAPDDDAASIYREAYFAGMADGPPPATG